MIIERLFSNKEQKRLRRKYDFEQGMGSTEKWGLSDEAAKNANARSQAEMLGFDKTNEIIKNAEKNTKTVIPETINVFGTEIPNYAKLGKRPVTSAKNKKEIDEIERARDIIREGRKRSRTESQGYTINTAEHLVDNSDRAVMNRAITSKKAGRPTVDWDEMKLLKKKLEEKAAKEVKQEAEAKVKQVGTKLKKAAPYVAGGLVAAGVGTAIYKHHKNKKKQEQEKS